MTSFGGMSEQMVYLVTAGSYSDYTVLGVFSTREKAEAFVAEYNEPDERYDKASVTEMRLDAALDERGAYEAEVRHDGTVIGFEFQSRESPTAAGYERPSPYGSVFVGYGKTKEHARRSAEELRRATITGSIVTPPPRTA